MNDFKDCYQSAVKDMHMLGMKDFHIDASQCMDEKRHSRWVARRMKRTAVSAFSAACVIFLCGFGTAKAAEYIENVIKVNQWGFESADAATMARNEAEGAQAHIVSEELGLGMDDEKTGTGSAGTEAAAMQEESADVNGEEEGVSAAAGKEQSGAEKEGKLADSEAADSGRAADALDGEAAEGLKAQEVQAEEIPVKSYTSLEEFEKNEDIIFPQPSIDIGNEAEVTNITVCGDWAMVRYDIGEKVIWVERTDYAQTRGHASSKVFPGGVCNERSYTTSQGYTYTLVDSAGGEEGELPQIHGAVTVGTYEAYVDFMGYTEEEVEEIIESIDLSLYE